MFVGIDIGTGSVKVALLDEQGSLVAQSMRPYAMTSTQPGYAEIDPERWWEATVDAVRECCVDHRWLIKGVGLSGQAHGFVLVGDDEKPLRPAILWPDVRTIKEVEEMIQLPDTTLLSLCNPLATGMAGPGLIWLSRHEPAVFEKAKKMLSPKDWIRLKMTGSVATEPSDASMTLLYDMQTDQWASELLDQCSINERLLPMIIPSTEAAGQIRANVATELGLPAGIPVATGLADCASCLVGMGVNDPNLTVLQIGSGIQIMNIVDRVTPEIQPFYNTFRGVDKSIYKMAALQNGGTTFEWIRQLIDATWDEMYRAAFEPNPGSQGIVFLPYACGERSPILDPMASASLTGMRLGCDRKHLIRAVFEGVALGIRDSWDALKATGVAADHMLLTGGGSRDPRWRQLLSNITGVPMRVVPEHADATTGAAFLGGIAAGHWHGIHDLPTHLSGEPLIEPDVSVDSISMIQSYRDTYARQKEIAL